MPETVHVLVRVQGEYSDRSETMVRAYRSAAAAGLAASRLAGLAIPVHQKFLQYCRETREERQAEVWKGGFHPNDVDREAARRWARRDEEERRLPREALVLDPGATPDSDWYTSSVELVD